MVARVPGAWRVEEGVPFALTLPEAPFDTSKPERDVRHGSAKQSRRAETGPPRKRGGFPQEARVLVRPRTLVAGCLLAAAVSGCTNIGFHDSDTRARLDFGASDSVGLCVYIDKGISEREARELIADAWKEEGRLYGLSIEIVKVVPWKRRGFMMDGIMESITRER